MSICTNMRVRTASPQQPSKVRQGYRCFELSFAMAMSLCSASSLKLKQIVVDTATPEYLVHIYISKEDSIWVYINRVPPLLQYFTQNIFIFRSIQASTSSDSSLPIAQTTTLILSTTRTFPSQSDTLKTFTMKLQTITAVALSALHVVSYVFPLTTSGLRQLKSKTAQSQS